MKTFTYKKINMNQEIELEDPVIISKTKSKASPTRYLSTNRKDWFFSAETTDTLPTGFYKIKFSQERGIYAKSADIKTDDLLILPGMPNKKVISEIEKFWDKEDDYTRYGMIHKRGILLYGPPGCGKSCMVSLLVKDVLERGGVAVEFDDVSLYSGWVKSFRDIEPNRPLLVLMEDIDTIIQQQGDKEISNVLDGVTQSNKVVYLATTNELDKLHDKIKKRPSRFDQIIEVTAPGDEDRGIYLDTKIKDEDKKRIRYDREKWIRDTKKMTLSHLRELIVSVVVIGNDYDETITKLKSMTSAALNSGTIGFGFR